MAKSLSAQEKAATMFGNARAYDRFMGRWSRQIAPLLIDFALVPDSGRVLDVGSGTGELAVAIASKKPGVQITGIDPSDEYVAYAVSTNRYPKRITFEGGDAQKLAFPNDTFAASLSLLVFNFIPDRAKAIGELRRVTNAGGRISAAIWDYGGRMAMLRSFWDAAVELNPSADTLDERHMPLCRAGELAALWRRAGLADVVEQPLDTTMRFESFADFWDPFLSGQGPAGAYTRKLERDDLTKLRSAVKRRLAVNSEDSPFGIPARVWAVRGTVAAKT
jgi:SAM-dependent methyltransferase